MSRNPRVDPRATDVLQWVDLEAGVQHGAHTYTVRARYPRHVHISHRWPDGDETHGPSRLRDWRMIARTATILHTAEVPDAE